MKFISLFEQYEYLKLFESLSPEEQQEVNKFKLFKNTIARIIENEHPSIETLADIRNKLNQYKNIIRQTGLSNLLNNVKSVEEFYNILNTAKINTLIFKWINALPVQQRNEIKQHKEYFDTFKNIILKYNLTDELWYKTNIVKKAAIHSTKSFLIFFEKRTEYLLKTDEEIINDVKQFENNGLQIEYLGNDYLIAWIYSIDASIAVGSPSWCISYPPELTNQWYEYILGENINKQYFIWDFTVPRINDNSLCGVTLDIDGNITDIQDINDASISSEAQTSVAWFSKLYPFNGEQLHIFYNYIQTNSESKATIDSNLLQLLELIESKNVHAVIEQINQIKTMGYIDVNNAIKISIALLSYLNVKTIFNYDLFLQNMNGISSMFIEFYESHSFEVIEILYNKIKNISYSIRQFLTIQGINDKYIKFARYYIEYENAIKLKK